MQFANDITPLTLASTALLRECLNDKRLNETEKQATQREIESRYEEVHQYGVRSWFRRYR